MRRSRCTPGRSAPKASVAAKARCSRSSCRSSITMVPDPPKPSPNDESDPHRRLRVFVVEDHQDTRDVLCMLLNVLGHDVVAARSMQQALVEIPPARCDVLLTDV